MPQTALERLLALAGLAAIAGLGALVVPAWLDYRDQTKPSTAVASPPAPAVTTATTPAAPPPGPAQAPTRAVLELAAVRGDCWVSVHAGSQTGPALYEGTLGPGERKTFARARLWVRVGATDNLDVTLDGERVSDLPSGTVDLVVTRSGVEQAQS